MRQNEGRDAARGETRRWLVAAMAVLVMAMVGCDGPQSGPGSGAGLDGSDAGAAAAKGTGGGEAAKVTPRDNRPDLLRVRCWENYITPSVAEDFAREFGVPLEIHPMESNEAFMEEVGAGERWDLATPSDYAVSVMKTRRMLVPLNHVLLNGLKHVERRFRNAAYDREARYSVPLFWGVTGFGYDKDEFPGEAPASWAYVFDAKKRQPISGRLSVLNDSRETIGAALMYLGFDPNSNDPAELSRARGLVLQVKRDLFNRTFESERFDEHLAAGMVALSHGWSADFARDVAADGGLGFCVPKEGYLMFIDNAVIPITSHDTTWAHRLIDYLLRPEVAAKLSNENGAAPCNGAALGLLKPEVKAGVGFMQPKGVPFHVLRDIGEGGKRQFDAIWQEVEALP